ncbi:protein kinase domain-containing protein [Baaleninema sp.]|uniref:protein kinase domain-containing protein n=1 Tax=Baaleninema sp. TaxID=3101197 RepID=UPI003D0577AC
MTFCLNPDCPQPENSEFDRHCLSCGFPLQVGDRYRAVRPIAVGGFGRTFLGIDEHKPSRPPCVIKQFDPKEQGTRNRKKAADLFRQEAERLDRLGRHPQIPNLLAYFEWNGRQYLIQEFIEGRNLEQELQEEGCFSETRIRQLLQEILPVLQFVHDRKVIHRDIKPENIIQGTDGQLYLVDFGASKQVTTENLAATGTTIGSAGYAAPEQTLGKATFASDIYSLGVTCIHLLTDVPPFDLYDSNEGKWVWRDYTLANRPLSEGFCRVLDKMLELGIRRRYQSIEQILKDLQRPLLSSRASESPSFSKNTPMAEISSRDAASSATEAEHRDRIRTSYGLWLLGFIFGTYFRPLKGLHRFYNGKIWTGLLWMIPVIGDVGSFIDLFLIPNLVEEYEQKARAKLGVSSSGVPLQPQSTVTQTLPTPTKDQQTVKLIRAASVNGGQLSVTQAVMTTGMSFAETEQLLMELVRTGYVDVDNDPISGVVVYRFREL